MSKQCSGHRRDGQPCTAPVLGAGGFCFAHDPAKATARQQARQRGGRNRGALVRLRVLCPPRLVPVFDHLEQALSEVHAGTLKPGQAIAMAALARAMVAVLQAGELEERVRRVEALSGESGGRPGAWR
jgi:hypothetical protein